MRIAVRLDDITPDMDWDKFWEFWKHQNNNFTITLSMFVTPFEML